MFLPTLPTDRLRRSAGARGPDGAESHGADPLVAVAKVKGAQRVAALDRGAAAAGIRPGMALADARAIRPHLRVAEADLGADRAAAGAILDWCRRFTPLVAPDGPDGILLDTGGVSHLFGGEARLVTSLEEGLARQGFAARAAIAGSPEAAWALARFGTCQVAPAPGDVDFERIVADLPLAALKLDAETVADLARAGLRRLGDLLMRPRAPVAARFGSGVFARLDGVMGRVRSPISPCFEAPAYSAERRFASGIARHVDLERAIGPLAHHLCALLSRAGEGARGMEATLFRVDGAVTRIAVGTSRPLRDPGRMMGLLREKIAALGEDGLDTGYGFDLIRLGVVAAEPLPSRQDGLPVGADKDRDRDRGDEGGHDLADLADKLGARLGLARVLRLHDGASHIPECAVVALPVSHADPAPAPAASETITGAGDVPCRPIRLFERPEPIDTIAAVPDGPPVRFRWRRVSHDIVAIEGPERIAPEWWRGQGLTRDYFRAEDRDGRGFWLFREGLFNREVPHARWFLHGLFG